MNRHLTFLACILAGAMTLHAVPAKREYRTFTQPDGSTITAMVIGDEFGHSYITTDGIQMLAAEDGSLRYATIDTNGNLQLSNIIAANPENRDAKAKSFIETIDVTKVAKAIEKNALDRRLLRSKSIKKVATKSNGAKVSAEDYSGVGLFTSNYPRKGEVHSLVFLVQYTDKKFTLSDPNAYYTDQLNKEGFSQHKATGSARDFFVEQSHGQFLPIFDVYGPMTLSNSMSYYGANDTFGNDKHPEEMVLEAVAAYANEIDYSKYDYDNDGYIDNVYVIYAGYGEADSNYSSAVWPHNWDIPNGPTYNGKILSGYACSNEISNGIPVGIGTFCHEYSHVLGLPDLYPSQNTSYQAYAVTPGQWSIMDQGSYNNDSRTPPAYSAVERNALGWMTPTILNEPASVSLEALTSSNEAYLIPTNQSNEFFILENRQQEGNDTYLPHHGMLVWHVDFDQNIWDKNLVNDTPSHNYVDIIKANNNAENMVPSIQAGYTYPGTSKNTSLTATTTPALVDWYNSAINVPITNIAESADGVITFDVMGGLVDFAQPAAPTLSQGIDGTITATWAAIDKAIGYDITIWTVDEAGNAKTYRDYVDKAVGNVTTYTINGLAGEKTYRLAYRATAQNNVSEYSDHVDITLGAVDFIYTSPTATNAIVNGNDVNMQWESLKNAVRYEVTAEVETASVPVVDIVNFGQSSDINVTIPSTWTWSGQTNDVYRSNSTGYYGEAAPALKFNATNRQLVSPIYEGEITELVFWLRAASANASSTFDIQQRAGEDDEWTNIERLAPLNNYNTLGDNIFTYTPAAGTHQIRFIYTKKATGNVALDDIKVTSGSSSYMSVLNRENAQSETNYAYTVATDAQKIRFYVEAIDADGRYSKPSNKIEVALGTSGIEAPVAANTNISVSGNTLLYSGNNGDIITVANISGAVVANAIATADGTATITLPANGLYIVATPNGATKIFVR